MKIRMKTLAVGPGVMFHPGKVYEVADTVGEPFVLGDYAVRLDVPATIVKDSPPTPSLEPAMSRRGRAKR